MQGHDIVVIGASAGGISALQALLAALPADLPAAVFVVLHGNEQRAGQAAKLLSAMGPLPAVSARHGARITPARIYIGRSDQRIILEGDRMAVVRSPSHPIPSNIDALFRSAALSHGPRVVGVVLSGLLNDGAAGLLAIQQQGGQTMVQALGDALYDDMPRHALEAVDAHQVLPASMMGAALGRLTVTPAGPSCRPTERLRIQVALERLGGSAPRGCDRCGTALREDRHGRLSFRCAGGHAFAAESIVAEHDVAITDALWAVLGALVETAALKRRLSRRKEDPEPEGKRARLERSARQASQHAQAVRRLLRSMEGPRARVRRRA